MGKCNCGSALISLFHNEINPGTMVWLLTSHTVAQLLIWLGGYLIPCKLKIRSRSEELNQEELKKHKGASTTHFHCWSHSSPTSWQPKPSLSSHSHQSSSPNQTMWSAIFSISNQ